MMTELVRQSLCEAAWELRPIGEPDDVPAALRGPIPAHVPGCVHTDLIESGIIRDPSLGMAELDQLWVGRNDWEYRRRFVVPEELREHERIDLVFDGLDTVAGISVNGVEVGRAANMFHPHRFAVNPALKSGDNELIVRFRSPLRHVREEERRLGPLPVNGDWDPYNYIRKAACNFGWDWAPKVPTVGIWKPVRLEAWSGVRIAGVRPLTRKIAGGWVADVHIDLEWSGSATSSAHGVSVTLALPQDSGGRREPTVSQVQPGAHRALVSISVESPRLWWPRGLGHGQPRYDIHVAISASGGKTRDRWHGKVGFRQVRLKTPTEPDGSGFVLEINGRELFCKGANWIPDGLFPSRMTTDRYRDRLRRALDANMNMLRVWGGGVYEADEFYELCDELGLLVWQDFMFACAMYPEEQPYPTLVEAEARHQIARLARHPSVALWCGGNECTWAYESWGHAPGETAWKDRAGSRGWGRLYYFDLLPKLLAELDPTRPYWPNSPWSGDPAVPNDERRGDRHTWDARGGGYRSITPRFCSEFGQQSPANYATLVRACGAENLVVGSPALAHRQRGTGGTGRHIDEPIAELFPPPRDLDEWHYLAQLAQSRALQTGIEWMRSRRPRCMGALVWQFNDAWPGLSWSLIDADGHRKPAWYAVAESFESRLLTIQPVDGRLRVIAINDALEPWVQRFEVRRLTFDGIAKAETGKLGFSVGPQSATVVGDVESLVGTPDEPARELVVASTFKQRRGWFYRPDKELDYPRPLLELGPITWGRGGGTSRGIARTLLRDIVIAEDRLEGTRLIPSTPFRTLLPGESFGLMIRTEARGDDASADLTPDRLSAPPVFWCANWFGRARFTP